MMLNRDASRIEVTPSAGDRVTAAHDVLDPCGVPVGFSDAVSVPAQTSSEPDLAVPVPVGASERHYAGEFLG